MMLYGIVTQGMGYAGTHYVTEYYILYKRDALPAWKCITEYQKGTKRVIIHDIVHNTYSTFKIYLE